MTSFQLIKLYKKYHYQNKNDHSYNRKREKEREKSHQFSLLLN